MVQLYLRWCILVSFSTAARLFDDVDTAIMAGLVLPLALFGLFANGVTIFVIHKSQNLKFVYCKVVGVCFWKSNVINWRLILTVQPIQTKKTQILDSFVVQ